MSTTVLLTGGAGYIGSHTAVELLQGGYDVVIADNFSNSSEKAIARIEEITGKNVSFYRVDLRDTDALDAVFRKHAIDAVIHFAGLKAVGESVEKPVLYYENNLGATFALLKVMNENHVNRIVFSSSATVYGSENPVPYTEKMPRGKCSNPYGWTKAMIEQILEDAAKANPELSVVLLRYFNPVGAHPSGLIGEDPKGIPNNLMPFISQVAVGRREHLTVFGNDYPTPDGTCLRDYIHVVDLADSHVKAIQYAMEHSGTEVFNIGTGVPYSVLDMVQTFVRATGVEVPYVIGPRRAGDLPSVYANASKANSVLGWKATRTLEDMCRDSWNWQSRNPKGYEE